MEKNYVALQLFPTGTQHLLDDGLGYYGDDWWLDHGHDNDDNVIQTEFHSYFDDEGDGETGIVLALSFHKLEKKTIDVLNILNVKKEHIEAIKAMSTNSNAVLDYLRTGDIERTSKEIEEYLEITPKQFRKQYKKAKEHIRLKGIYYSAK